jgi:anti-anti-sigma regulatory factor
MAQFEVTPSGSGTVRASLAGELVGTGGAGAVRRRLAEQYASDGVDRIEVDVSGVSLIDLEGVAALVVSSNDASRSGKRMQVVGAQGQVREKLRTTGVLRLLEEGG